MGEGGIDDSLIGQRLFVVFLWHMERGGQGPSVVIWFPKGLGERTGLIMLRSVFFLYRFIIGTIISPLI